jgi:hypothetical protein
MVRPLGADANAGTDIRSGCRADEHCFGCFDLSTRCVASHRLLVESPVRRLPHALGSLDPHDFLRDRTPISKGLPLIEKGLRAPPAAFHLTQALFPAGNRRSGWRRAYAVGTRSGSPPATGWVINPAVPCPVANSVPLRVANSVPRHAMALATPTPASGSP